MCEFMLDALVAANCKKIILALAELQDDLKRFIESYQQAHPGIEVIPSIEIEPLGTAGPIALARKHLKGHRFFMLNSDIMSIYPFTDLLKYHMNHDGEATIMSINVEDGSRYGVIDSDAEGVVTGFREKPTENNKNVAINAGHYILEPSVVDLIPEKFCSIEREIFPEIASRKQLHVMKLQGHWMDIGTPQAFLEAIPLAKETLKIQSFIDETSTIAEGVHIGDDVVIGPHVTIGKGSKLDRCVILEGTVIGENTTIQNSIIGWRNKIGNNVSVTETTVTGRGCTIKDETKVSSMIVCPYITVDKNSKPKSVMI